MLRKPDLYKKAVAFRYRGFSYNEILKQLPVAESTISRWCSKIPLTPKQKERLLRKKRNPPLICQLRKQAIQSKKEARIWAKKQINKLLNSDKEKLLLISGALLYWAEGIKQSGCKGIGFTNTDSRMISVVMQFFREIFNIPENKFKITVRMGEKGNIKKAENYWSKLTKVPKAQFNKPELLILKENSKSLEKYPNGMCRININDVSISRKLNAFIEEFVNKIMSP